MNEVSDILKPGQQIKARLNESDVEKLVMKLYGLDVSSIIELDAYDDRNFRITCVGVNNPFLYSISEHGYVLKIVNSLDSQKVQFFDAQNELLIFLGKKGFACPQPVRQLNGSYYSVESFESGGKNRFKFF